MSKTNAHFFLLISFLFITHTFLAQKDSTKAGKENIWWKKGKQYVIVTNDGTEYIGEIVGDNDREILIMTKTMGKLYIPKYSVKSVTIIDKSNFENGEFLDENRHKNFYMLGTNALPFKKREFRVSHAYFFGFSGTYTINENVAVGIQTSIIGTPMGLVLKTSFPISDKNYVGTDFNIASMTYIESGSYIGNISAKYTHGDEKTNVTIAGGVGFSSFLQQLYTYNGSSNVRKSENEYYFNAGIFHRLTKNAGFTAEGWLIPRQNFGLIGLGIRTLRRKDVSWSFGFYNAIYQGYSNTGYNPYGPAPKTTKFTPIPFFGATYTL
ncbi:MAG: hypothetical protein Q8M29_05725 [Bacteroidota bacterium]|nr:hypothetical protein [Bacteroidota bacterium]